ncbi:hypothetical protein JA1_001019 [Spathaspora sp. JA1]|nr:hypothetical protein JA1_001019 [Spathaspora sp. JA1]
MSEYAEKPQILQPQSQSSNINDEKIEDRSTPVSERDVHEIFTLADAIREEVYSVDSITQANDLSVLRAQLSSDEIVNEADVLHTEQLIKESREAQEEEEEEEYEEEETYEVNIWSVLQKGAINLVLPFVNGMMLGFGEILAHEIGFRYGWLGAKVEPEIRMTKRELERKQQQQQQQKQGSRFL